MVTVTTSYVTLHRDELVRGAHSSTTQPKATTVNTYRALPKIFWNVRVAHRLAHEFSSSLHHRAQLTTPVPISSVR
jgi:hypothetical protein